MSAFVVSKSHIDAMVRAGLGNGHNGARWYWNDELHKLDHTTADRIGAMLLAENVRSVGYRYSEPGREAIYGEGWETPSEDLPCTMVSATIEGVEVMAPEYLAPYKYRDVRYREPVVILKAISCYEYQSCETPDWNESEAFAFCAALKDHMISKLPGYEDARWELS